MPALIPLLVLISFLAAVASAAGRCPLWVSVILITVIMLIQVWR